VVLPSPDDPGALSARPAWSFLLGHATLDGMNWRIARAQNYEVKLPYFDKL